MREAARRDGIISSHPAFAERTGYRLNGGYLSNSSLTFSASSRTTTGSSGGGIVVPHPAGSTQAIRPDFTGSGRGSIGPAVLADRRMRRGDVLIRDLIQYSGDLTEDVRSFAFMVDCQGGDGSYERRVVKFFMENGWDSAGRMLEGDVADLLSIDQDNEYFLRIFGASSSGDFIRCPRRTLRLLYESYGVWSEIDPSRGGIFSVSDDLWRRACLRQFQGGSLRAEGAAGTPMAAPLYNEALQDSGTSNVSLSVRVCCVL